MLSQRKIDVFVGLFLLMAIAALIALAFKVSGLTTFFKQPGYTVIGEFDDIGQLKIRAPIKMGGVTIGEVTGINLDHTTFRAQVKMRINSSMNAIPSDSSASIMTAGLLGDNYVAITPMYNSDFLKDGSYLQETHSAMILEKLIGQLMFKIGNSGSKKQTDENTNLSKTTHGGQ